MEIVDLQKKLKIPRKQMGNLVKMIADEEGLQEGVFVITFMDTAGIARINKEYLGREGSTNVITFSYIRDFNKNLSPVVAEIFINTDRVFEEAEEAEMDVMERFWQLAIHGILHGFDYEHEGVPESKAEEMRRREEYYFKKWRAELNGEG